jgi:hypothetical protein
VTYDSEVLAEPSLWGYWKGEETSGTTLVDSSTNSRNMSIPAGAPAFGAAGPVVGVKALDWPSSNGATEYYAITAVSQSGGAITMEAWVYLTALPATNTVVVGKALSYGNHNGNAALTVDTAGKATFWTYDGVAVRTAKAASALSLNAWHHLVGSTGAANTKIRVDKVTVGTDSGTTTAAGADLLMIHGGTNNTDTPDLRGDNSAAIVSTRHAFYTAQLTDTRTDAHYDAMLPLTVTGSGSAESDASATGGMSVVAGAGSGSGDSNASATAQVVTAGVTANRAGGRNREAFGNATWYPPVAAVPLGPRARVAALAFGVPVMDRTQPRYDVSAAYAEQHWDRLIVGGRDVTYFRGVATPFSGFGLEEPLMYGPTTITFPQIAGAFETLGAGDLTWLRKGARVYLQRIDGAGDVVATDYRGVVVDFDVTGNSVSVSVGGEAQGRMALVNRQVPIWTSFQDIGRYAYSAFKEVGLRLTPYLGPTTGVRLQRFGGQSLLDYVAEILARSWNRAGNQWTIMPTEGLEGVYAMARKDTTTIRGTVYADDARTVVSLHRAASEEPNRIFMTGVTPAGERVRFGVYPGLVQGAAAPYPFNDHRDFGTGTTDAGTDTGDGISIMIARLIITKYLDQEDTPGGYDQQVANAIRNLQEDMGRAFVTGTMDYPTWRGLYDLDVTGASLRWSHIEPAAQRSKVRKWNRSGSGAIMSRNTHFDPAELIVDTNIDVGSGFTRDQMREYGQAELQTEDNWTGTVTFGTGALVAGTHTPGDPITTADLLRARALRPGDNLWFPLFDGGTLFHIATINVDASGVVQAAIDTRARDAMKVWEVITRNRESRHSPARAWTPDNRSSTMTKDSIGIWDEVGGLLNSKLTIPANTWTVVPVVAGQEGTVRSLRLTTSPAAEYVVAVTGDAIYPERLASLVGNPLTHAGAKRWASQSVHDALDAQNVLLYVAGTNAQPCGYYPGQKGEKDENDVAYTLTGRWEDDAGFSYHTGEHPVLYLAIFADRATTIPVRRVMWNQLEAGV